MICWLELNNDLQIILLLWNTLKSSTYSEYELLMVILLLRLLKMTNGQRICKCHWAVWSHSFFFLLFHFFSSSEYTHRRAQTNFEDGTVLLMNTRANKNNTKKTFDWNEIDSHAFVYLSVRDMLMFHLSANEREKNPRSFFLHR